MINGIIVQNNPLKYVDPRGLQTRSYQNNTSYQQPSYTPNVSLTSSYNEVPGLPNNTGVQETAQERHYRVSEIGYKTADGKLPRTFEQLTKRDDYTDFEYFGETPTHNLGGISGNRDWRNPVTGEQFVFDVDGRLVTDPLNQGTYDKSPPKGIFGTLKHNKVDVKPYIKYGNAKDDPSTKKERRKALRKTILYGIKRKLTSRKKKEAEKQRWIDSVTQ